jgi:transposase-like protein DUF772
LGIFEEEPLQKSRISSVENQKLTGSQVGSGTLANVGKGNPLAAAKACKAATSLADTRSGHRSGFRQSRGRRHDVRDKGPLNNPLLPEHPGAKNEGHNTEAFSMQRTNASPTFTDAAVVDLGGPRTVRFLQTCEELVPWKQLVEAVLPLFRAHENGGRPFWSALVMIKCVLLQKWFGLSDPQLEEQLRDRLSFRRFVGLSIQLLRAPLGSTVPDSQEGPLLDTRINKVSPIHRF